MQKNSVLSELLFPEGIKCIICSDELPISDSNICVNCKVKRIDKYCFSCGREINNASNYCDYCQNYKNIFSLARSSYLYADDVKKLIYNYKYSGQKFISKYLAEILLITIRETVEMEKLNIDYITYVPLHKSRLKKRGFNQSKLLADIVGESLKIKVFEMLLKTTKSKNMAKLNSKQRHELIKNSFAINDEVVKNKNELRIENNKDEKVDLTNKNIILIDDVLTTGATVNECARTLKTRNCADIYVFTVASVLIKQKLI